MTSDQQAFELRQTREFTATEQRELMALWRELLWPQGAGAWYNTSYYLFYGFAGFLVLSIWMSVDRLAHFTPKLAGQLAIAAVGFAAALAALQWVSIRLQQRLYWQHLSPDDQYLIAERGVRRITAESDSIRRWQGIERLVCTERYVALICGGSPLLLAKAAFADQDIEGFCAELQRRWTESRVPSA